MIFLMFLHLFADDIATYAFDADSTIVQNKLNSDLASLFKWLTSNGFTVKYLCFGQEVLS